MDLNQELGVKGFCFRGYADNATVAEKVKACGLERIDLSRPQVDFRRPELHEPAIAAYREAGVKIVGIGVVTLEGNDGDRQYFEFCRKAGCRTISVNGDPATFQRALESAQRWAEQYDMTLAIHNHGGGHWLGNAQMLEHVLANAPDRVGLCLDTAWCIQAGEDPLQWVDRFAGRLFAVHYKDFTFDAHGKPSDVVVGRGALDLSGFAEKLNAIDFNGPAVIEYEADVDNPVPALTRCVQAMREVLSGAPALV